MNAAQFIFGNICAVVGSGMAEVGEVREALAELVANDELWRNLPRACDLMLQQAGLVAQQIAVDALPPKPASVPS